MSDENHCEEVEFEVGDTSELQEVAASPIVATLEVENETDSPEFSVETDPVYGPAGRGIVSIIKTGTSGLVDTYTITYSDGTTSTFTVTNGASGSSDHRELTNRDADEQHPISAITGLQAALNAKVEYALVILEGE